MTLPHAGSFFAKDREIWYIFPMIFDVISNPLFLTYAMIVCVVILLGLVWHLHRKIRRLLMGKNSESLEDSLVTAKANLEKLNAFQRQVISHLETVEKRLSRSVQAVETIRFNPFKGVGEGGNQSFSTVL